MAMAYDQPLAFLNDVETAGEDILICRRDIVDIDRKRNKNREALRSIMKTDEEKVWLCFGHLFIKADKDLAKKVINDDQSELNERINVQRDHLKSKVSHLRELEGHKRDKGFDLKPLSF